MSFHLSPEVLGAVAIAVIGAGYYAYHRVTGERVEADIDQDGETDFVLEEHDGSEGEDHATNEVVAVASETAQEVGGELAQVKGVGETRAEKFIDAGFETASDLYFASDEDLTSVNGIGEATVEMIREDLGRPEDNPN